MFQGENLLHQPWLSKNEVTSPTCPRLFICKMKGLEHWSSVSLPSPQKIVLPSCTLHWITRGHENLSCKLPTKGSVIDQEVQLILWNPSSPLQQGHISHRLLPAHGWAQQSVPGRHRTPLRHRTWFWLKDSLAAMLNLPWTAQLSWRIPPNLFLLFFTQG